MTRPATESESAADTVISDRRSTSPTAPSLQITELCEDNCPYCTGPETD